MLGKQDPQRSMFQLIDLENLVPEDHLLRQIDRAINLSFIRDRVAPLYTEGWGRPSVDPELALRMMLLGYLFNLSDLKLCEEVQMHAGFRWFCRLEFHDPVPDRTTLVKLRRERWGKDGVFDDLMREVVRQCVAAGLVTGKHLAVDGTQVTANAAITSLEAIQPAVSLQEYLDRFSGKPEEREDKEPPEGGSQPPPHRKAGAPDFRGERFSNATHRSRTDPEARLYRKASGQEAKLRYLVHDLVDVRSGVIVATTATQATGTAEREAGLELLKRAIPVLPRVKGRTLAGDGGYESGAFLVGVLEQGVEPYVPLQNMDIEPVPTWKRRTLNLHRYRMRKKKRQEVLARNRIRMRPKLVRRRVYRGRIRVERSFAEAKQWHGLDRARSRGLAAMRIQALMTATVQNMKRLARYMGRKGAGKAAAQDDKGLLPSLIFVLISWVRRAGPVLTLGSRTFSLSF